MHPDYFFEQSPETGLVNPANLNILANHLKCAAFELAFVDGENFGEGVDVATTGGLLTLLEEDRFLNHNGDRWYWMAESYPSESISPRGAHDDNFLIIDQTEGARVIGEIDQESAPTMIHEGAIYLHQGQQYQVERLDYDDHKAYVRSVDVDYYTDASLAVNIQPLDVFDAADEAGQTHQHGEVSVTYLATMYKKIKLDTHENLGWGRIHLPEQTLHTTAYGIGLGDDLAGQLDRAAACYEAALAADLPAILRRRCVRHLSILYKRERRWPQAVALWERCCEDAADRDLHGHLELAKYYEHVARDPRQAIRVVERALLLIEVGALGGAPARLRRDWEARQRRLQTKLRGKV